VDAGIQIASSDEKNENARASICAIVQPTANVNLEIDRQE
jgi:hypothetical protein